MFLNCIKIWISSFFRKIRRSDDIRPHILAWKQLAGDGEWLSPFVGECPLYLDTDPLATRCSFLVFLTWMSQLLSWWHGPRATSKGGGGGGGRYKRAAEHCTIVHTCGWQGNAVPHLCLGFVWWEGEGSSHPIRLTASRDSALCHVISQVDEIAHSRTWVWLCQKESLGASWARLRLFENICLLTKVPQLVH